MADTGYVWPIAGQSRQQARITNAFGAPQVRSAGWTGSLPPTNNGVDIAAPAGTGLVAPASGRVVEVRRALSDNSGWGNSIVIQDAQGRQHRLSHLMDEPSVKVGDSVQAGQPIGRVGATGNATGPHLDYELRVNGQPRDALSTVFGAGAPITVAPRAGAQPMADGLSDIYDPTLRYAQNPMGPAGVPAAPAGQPGESQLLQVLRRQLAEARQQLAEVERQYTDLVGGDPRRAALDQAQALEKRKTDIKGVINTTERQIAEQEGKPAAAAAPPTTRQGPNGAEYQWNAETKQWEPAPGIPPPAVPKAQRRTQIVGTNLIDLDTGEVIAQVPASAQGKRTQVVGGNLIDLDTGAVIAALPQEAGKPSTVTSGGRVIGFDPVTGEPKFTLDTRTEEEREAAKLDASYKAETIRLGTQVRDELTAALALPPGPERDAAIEQVTRKYAALDGPAGARELLRMGQEQAAQKQRQATELSRQTGFQYDWETMQPKTDPITGQPLKTAEQQERERVAETARQTLDQSRRNADLTAGTSLYNQATQNAVSLGNQAARNAIDTLPYLAPAGTTQDLADLRNAFSTGTRPPPTPVRSMPMPFDPNQIVQSTVAKALAQFSPFAEQLLARAGLGATPGGTPPTGVPTPGAAPPAGGPTPPLAPPRPAMPAMPAMPSAPSAPPLPPIPQPPQPPQPPAPVAAAAALVPPPPLGEPETTPVPMVPPLGMPAGGPETVMLPNGTGVPSPLDELLRQLDLAPAWN